MGAAPSTEPAKGWKHSKDPVKRGLGKLGEAALLSCLTQSGRRRAQPAGKCWGPSHRLKQKDTMPFTFVPSPHLSPPETWGELLPLPQTDGAALRRPLL